MNTIKEWVIALTCSTIWGACLVAAGWIGASDD